MGFHLQESAEHHEHHDDEETEGKERVLRSPKRKEHDFDGSSNVPLSQFIDIVTRVHLQEECVIISERSEHPK